MGYTDRHFRFFARQITRKTLLYTEMITTGALLHGDTARYLAHDPAEYPLAIQLGGSDPKDLATCAQYAEQAGFCEVNLNVGCPSERVQNGQFGLCLMKQPQRVSDCVQAMKASVSIPITVKTRIGVDEQQSLDHLLRFVDVLHASGVDHLCLHARCGWLSGLNPKENRSIPPLNHDHVYAVKAAYPALSLGINGGINTLAEAKQHLARVDEVMIGRAAYHHPFMLLDADTTIFGQAPNTKTRQTVLNAILNYIEQHLTLGVPMQSMSKHLLHFFHAQQGAKAFKRYLSEHLHRTPTLATLERALQYVVMG